MKDPVLDKQMLIRIAVLYGVVSLIALIIPLPKLQLKTDGLPSTSQHRVPEMSNQSDPS